MIFASKHVPFSRVLAQSVWVVAVSAIVFAAPCVLAGPAMVVRGNRHLSEERVRQLLGELNWDGRGDDGRMRELQEAYIREGRLFATIHVERHAADSTIVVVIDEGEAARLGRVAISGMEHFDEETVRAILGAGAGEPYRPGPFGSRIDRLLADYDNDGYPFAQVWLDSLRLDGARHEVNLVMNIVEGGAKTLHAVDVVGLEKTRKELAVKLSGLKVGEPYSGERLRDAYLRMTTSGIFDDVEYPAVRLSPSGRGVDALIRVAETARSNSFSSAFGYADREGRQDKVVSGMVQLDLLNVGGSLRDLNVSWRNDGAGRNQMRIRFKQRFFLGRRLSFGITLEQVGLDTLYTWQSIGVETKAPIGRVAGGLFGVDGGVFADRNTFSIGEATRTLRLRLLGGFSYVRGRLHRGTFFEFRNRNIYARKDLNLREDGRSESVTQYIAELDARAVFGVLQNVSISNEVHGRNIASNEELVPLSEQYNFGGAATLRGYRENQFHSRWVVYTRSELLLGRSRIENGYFFADTGYFLDEALNIDGTIDSVVKVRLGYGFGLRTRSRLGNIDLSFGVGEKLSLRQTKVHVILNRRF